MESKLSDKKWYPHNKGGAFRRWYGNQEYVINYKYNGQELAMFSGASTIPNDIVFKPAITYSRLGSGQISFRLQNKGFIFDSAAVSMFVDNKIQMYVLAVLNTLVVQNVVGILAPTLNTQPGDIGKVPIIIDEIQKPQVEALVEQNISLSKTDWDSFETSWDFCEHPFVRLNASLWDATGIGATMYFYYGYQPKVSCPLELSFMLWQGECNKRFKELKSNEEELNRIFIDIYGLQDELTPEVEDKDVTVRLADKTRDIKSFISYAVGCMFGRYSLDVDGLAYAGGEFQLGISNEKLEADNSSLLTTNSSLYKTFLPDKDNCIPITDESYFDDDIVSRFCEFVKVVYGAETLEQNLDFIADALPTKGDNSRDVIRNYFLKDFFKDHVKTYQKRPIYWLYDSGKQDGFKALVYMHRYNQDTTGLVRVDYLHNLQKIYESEIITMKENVDTGHEVAKSQKRLEKLTKQLKEAKEYDEKIAHLALSRIAIDLDDGVKVNYEKVQIGQDGKYHQILGKI